MEGDKENTRFNLTRIIFQSTPSAWRETLVNPIRCRLQCNFNPLPPHGGRPETAADLDRWEGISIHSLRMEGDLLAHSYIPRRQRNFNPLPPHGGRHGDVYKLLFDRADFNPLPPHGGRQHYHHLSDQSACISIHSLRMEGDHGTSFFLCTGISFQSTPSAWRET